MTSYNGMQTGATDAGGSCAVTVFLLAIGDASNVIFLLLPLKKKFFIWFPPRRISVV
jgi:hypothetical protein